MVCVFASHRTHFPERGGGAQRSIHALLERLAQRGHDCQAVAAIQSGVRQMLFRGARRATGRRLLRWTDRRPGYPTHRTWDPLLLELFERTLDSLRPDVVVADFDSSDRLVGESLRRRLPTLLRIVDAGFESRAPLAPDACLLPFANSRFIAERFAAWSRWPVPPVLYPIVDATRYAVPRPNPEYVTLVNPRPLKGLDLVLDVAARLPHRQFLLVESWPLPREQALELARRLAALTNVRLQRWIRDPRPVYASTAVLLMPSLVEEAFGRVVLEAQASGIPVIARRAGGLAETVGAGGIVLDSDADAAIWADTLEALLADRSRSEVLAAQARANARRDEFAADVIAERFEALLLEHTQARRCA